MPKPTPERKAPPRTTRSVVDALDSLESRRKKAAGPARKPKGALDLDSIR